MIKEQQQDQIEEFIFSFLNHQKSAESSEIIRKQFRTGYCWHFANILRDTFHRGRIYWTAPLGHMVWGDPASGKYYDIEGEYIEDQHDVFYMIPTDFLGVGIRSFMHIPNDGHVESIYSRKELIEVVKTYCNYNNILYDKEIEKYFK